MDQDIILRPIEFSDLDYLHKWRNDPQIFTQLGNGYFPTSKSEMGKWMDNFCKLDKNNIRLIIEFNHEVVGFISLTNINYINRTGELGMYIGERNHQGKGIATKAIIELETFVKNNLNLRKIKLLVNSNNNAAIHLYKKCYYNIIGTYHNERLINSKWVDVYIMEKML